MIDNLDLTNCTLSHKEPTKGQFTAIWSYKNRIWANVFAYIDGHLYMFLDEPHAENENGPDGPEDEILRWELLEYFDTVEEYLVDEVNRPILYVQDKRSMLQDMISKDGFVKIEDSGFNLSYEQDKAKEDQP